MGASRSGSVWKYVIGLMGVAVWQCGAAAVLAQHIPSRQPTPVQTEQQLREIRELVQQYQSYQTGTPLNAQQAAYHQPANYNHFGYLQDQPVRNPQDFDPSPDPPVNDIVPQRRQQPQQFQQPRQQQPPQPTDLFQDERSDLIKDERVKENIQDFQTDLPIPDLRPREFTPDETKPDMLQTQPPPRDIRPVQPQQRDTGNRLDVPQVHEYPPGAVLPEEPRTPSQPSILYQQPPQPRQPRTEIQPQPYQHTEPQYLIPEPSLHQHSRQSMHPQPAPHHQSHPNDQYHYGEQSYQGYGSTHPPHHAAGGQHSPTHYHQGHVGTPGAYFDQRNHWGATGVQNVAPRCGVDCGFECGDPVFYLTGYGSAVDLRNLVSGDNTIETDNGGGFGFALGRWQGRNLRTEIEYGFRTNSLLSLETATDFQALNGKIKSQSGMANAYWEFSNFQLLRLKPYVGAGLGFAKLDTDLARPGMISLTPERLRESSFAWQFMGGVSVKTQRNFDLFIEYRLFQTDPFRIETFTGAGDGNYDYRANNLVGGLSWKF